MTLDMYIMITEIDKYSNYSKYVKSKDLFEMLQEALRKFMDLRICLSS